MIESLEEAQEHCKHVNSKSVDFVIVLPDGGIHKFDLIEKAQEFLTNNPDCFVVKGVLEKGVKEKKQKNKE